MKTFKLDQRGDVVINDNKIELVSDMELIAQTITRVLHTNIGEWFGDEEEGIDFSVILTKNPNYDLIEDTIDTAVQAVADSFGVELDTDNYEFTRDGRTLHITFTLTLSSEDGEEESTEVEVTL